MRNGRTRNRGLNQFPVAQATQPGKEGSFGPPTFPRFALASSYTKCVPLVWAAPRFSVSLLQEVEPDM